MNLYNCGTSVEPKTSPGINAQITAVTIRFGKVAYECSYFWNGEYRTCWLDESEFITDTDKKLKIGFKRTQ